MAKKNKIIQAEQITIQRSEVNFASYNPRKISDEARKMLKRNLTTVGLLGGIVWNRRTGNLVSGHQKVAIMDSVNRYDDETQQNDYEFRVEVVDFDETTEKEQNLFMNNRNVQGTFDETMLREMLEGIDYQNAGYNDFDMEMLGLKLDDYNPGYESDDADDYDGGDNTDTDASDGGSYALGDDTAQERPQTPTNPVEIGHGAWTKEQAIGDSERLAQHDERTGESAENHRLDRSADFYNDTAENQIARHNEVQKIKDRINSQNDLNKDSGMASYVTISFRTPSEKMNFMESYGYDPFAKFINGEEFVRKLEFGDDEDDEGYDNE